ncbi:Heterokaryon incompatibility protein (HET) domain containing protein [Naviculisporaceae sp. PSN 640]
MSGTAIWQPPGSNSDQGTLCTHCFSMTGTKEGLEAVFSDGGYKHLSVKELQDEAGKAQGCYFCKYLFESLREVNSPWWPRVIESCLRRNDLVIIKDLPEPAPFGKLARDSLQPPEFQLERIEAQTTNTETFGGLRMGAARSGIVAAESNPAAIHVSCRPLSKTLTPTLASAMRKALDDCLDHHDTCPQRSSLPPKLPSRVLDLRLPVLEVTPVPSRIYLYEPEENTRAEYVALSYCWGDPRDNVTTTTANYANILSDGICASALPKTIMDSIRVCTSLKLQYLWVDALCIVQDNEENKHSEIAKMADIYRNSTVAIVAASAERVSDGFLDNYDELVSGSVQPLPLYLDKYGGPCGTIYLRQEKDHLLQHEPLFKRAWAYQEYVLPARALVFNSTQALFKCNPSRGSLEPILKTNIWPWGPTFNTGVVGKSSGPVQGYDGWTGVVETYSMRKLTLFSDRLSALAGVASMVGNTWKDEYIAGLWASTLAKSLFWKQDSTEGPIASDFLEGNKLKAVAPSWSWASSPYPTRILTMGKPDVKLVGHYIELASLSSPYGPVRRGTITLEARVLKVSDFLVIDGMNYAKFCIEFDRHVGWDLAYQRPAKPELEEKLGNLKLLYLGRCNGKRFLVVEKTDQGNFRRVGHCRLYLSSWFPNKIAALDWEKILAKVERQIIVLE